MDQFTVRNNWSSFAGVLISFTMVKMSKFIQNVMKSKVNYDTFWCNGSSSSWNFISNLVVKFDSTSHVDAKSIVFTQLMCVLKANFC